MVETEWNRYRVLYDAVDGRNPVDMVNVPLSAGFHTCQCSFHQQTARPKDFGCSRIGMVSVSRWWGHAQWGSHDSNFHRSNTCVFGNLPLVVGNRWTIKFLESKIKDFKRHWMVMVIQWGLGAISLRTGRGADKIRIHFQLYSWKCLKEIGEMGQMNETPVSYIYIYIYLYIYTCVCELCIFIDITSL